MSYPETATVIMRIELETPMPAGTKREPFLDEELAGLHHHAGRQRHAGARDARAVAARDLPRSAASASPPRCRPTGCWRTAACSRRGRSRATTWRRDRASALKTPAITRPPAKPTAGRRLGHHPGAAGARPQSDAGAARLRDSERRAAGGRTARPAAGARGAGQGRSTTTSTPARRGDAQLRREIARRALRWGQALAPDDIVITCGCTEALTLALRPWRSPATPSPSSRRPISALLHAHRDPGAQGAGDADGGRDRHRPRRAGAGA